MSFKNTPVSCGTRTRIQRFKLLFVGCKLMLATLPLLFLCGCFDVKEDFVLEADGSGSIRIETKLTLPPEAMESMSMGGEAQALAYPPLTEEQAKKLFPGNDFSLTIEDQESGPQKVAVVKVTFKDINVLLKSPYGRARALAFELTNGVMTFKAITGVEAAAHLAMAKDDMFKEFGPGIKIAELRKAAEKMRAEFRVTLPGAVSGGNGTREGRTSSWTFERAKAKDAPDFARQLATVLQASFSAEGLKFSPRQIPRPALQRFNELQETVLVDKGDSPDEKKIAAVAKFVPCSLQVTRSVDLSGDGGSEGSQAALTGMLVIPRAMAPEKWGQVQLEEALDSNGNSLKTAQDRVAMQVTGGTQEDESDSEKPSIFNLFKPRETDLHRHITIRFQSPEWQAKEILRLKGSVGMTYYGGTHLLKITNAILAGSLKEMKADGGMDFSEGAARALAHPKLGELGLSLLLQNAMRMGQVNTLMMKSEGKTAAVKEVQAYDKDGKPWPTYLNLEGQGQEDGFQIIVIGEPVAPLSLALLVSGGGTTVQVPILLEHIPTSGPAGKDREP